MKNAPSNFLKFCAFHFAICIKSLVVGHRSLVLSDLFKLRRCVMALNKIYRMGFFLFFAGCFFLSCGSGGGGAPAPTSSSASTSETSSTPGYTGKQLLDKFSLWDNGTQLRGANIYQRKVYGELDGTDFWGPGPVGPPLKQEDFDKLSHAGANLVVLSHPGLFNEKPPYALNQGIQDNLDTLVAMAKKADLFVVIAFRTGPGRSEFAFVRDDVGTWFDASYFNDEIWKDMAVQDAYTAMWKHTADRYKDNSVIVGYDLMVEPDANTILEVVEPDEFYQKYKGTTYDWNVLHAKISKAIRGVDKKTPILIGGMDYSLLEWLPYIVPNGDGRTIYTFHQYAPHEQYTHQETGADGSFANKYPGRFDIDEDGIMDDFNKGWINNLLGAVDAFKAKYGTPVAVTEYGVIRWEPGADSFLNDEIGLFEKHGLNHAIWEWSSSHAPVTNEINDFTFSFGQDKNSKSDANSKLFDTIKGYWKKNAARPSQVQSLPAYPEEAVATSGLKTLAEKRGIRIGANYDYELASKTHDKIFEREFNAMTVYMGWDGVLYPDSSSSDILFTEPDERVARATTLGMEIFGQTLVWFEDIPEWVKKTPLSQVEAVMFKHIDTVVRHYAGRVKLWNVVNEAIDDEGSIRLNHRWAEAMGADYISKAFIRAHAADPAAILYYNEYDIESNTVKYNAVKALLKDLLSKGVPLHALGWQMHVKPGSFDTATLLARMNEIADMGLDNYITELDVELPSEPTTADYENQKQTYKSAVSVFLSARRHKSIIIWGVQDSPKSFVPYGLPFDKDFQKKPAYYGIQEALLGK